MKDRVEGKKRKGRVESNAREVGGSSNWNASS